MPSGISVGDWGEVRKGSEACEAGEANQLQAGLCWVARGEPAIPGDQETAGGGGPEPGPVTQGSPGQASQPQPSWSGMSLSRESGNQGRKIK